MIRHWMTLLAGVSLAGAPLAGCSVEIGPSDSASPGNAAGKASPEEEAAAQVVRRPKPEIAKARLPGRWSRDADCGRTLEFKQDGALTAFDGAPGNWSITGESQDGSMLRMEGEGRIANMEVTLVATDELHLRDTDPGTGGKTIYFRRCS
jgi:hypothetical protein